MAYGRYRSSSSGRIPCIADGAARLVETFGTTLAELAARLDVQLH